MYSSGRPVYRSGNRLGGVKGQTERLFRPTVPASVHILAERELKDLEVETLNLPIEEAFKAFSAKCVGVEIVSPDAVVSVDALFAAWKTWCQQQGHEPGSKNHFGRNLRSQLPLMKGTKLSRAAGEHRSRAYRGVGLRPGYGV